MEQVYFDYAASTPLDPRVRMAVDVAHALVGNPSSLHRSGREVRAAIDRARGQIARLICAADNEVVFTSGATEANGVAITGVLRAIKKQFPQLVPHIVTSEFEHASITETLAQQDDARVTYVTPGRDGVVTADVVAAAITEETVIVCVMWVNNVLGTVQPIEAISVVIAAERARRGAGGLPIVFICDAVQAIATLPISDEAADILTISAHKMYGPKGVGAIRIASGTPFASVYGGGGQENGRRHGTENVMGIVGFGEAAMVLLAERARDVEHITTLRYILFDGLQRNVPAAAQVGAEGVPGTIFLRIPGERGDELALKLDTAGFAVSAGSACDAGKRRAPRALEAVLDEQSALKGGVRVSFGRFTTEQEIKDFVATLAKMVR